MIRVLIADDQDLVRAGVRALLEHDPGLEVVAEAASGAQAVMLSREHRPDVVLMDLRMPGGGGLDATTRILGDPATADTRVIVLTTFDDEADILEAIRRGAAGYLLKDTGSDELRRAIVTVAEGGSLLSPKVTARVMEHLAAAPVAPEPDPRLRDLTERELAVLRRVALGETNAEIGVVLHLSPATVRTYVSRIITRLGARDRTELAILAHRSGLG